MVVHLSLRFDEALQVDTSSDNVKQQDTSVPVVSTPVFQRTVIGDVTGRKASALQPLVFPSDNLTQLANRIPKKGDVELPGMRQAGKFNLTFDFRDLPLDPRMIRACGVEVYLGAVPAQDFAYGITGDTDPVTGQRTSILATAKNGFPRTEDMLLVGTVDTWAVEHGETSSEVTIEGRDLRGIFLDAKCPVDKLETLDLRKPITEVVKDILGLVPAELGFRVEVRGEDFLGSEPSPADVEGLTRVRKGADGKQTKSKPPGSETLGYWDIITRYCQLCGCIPYFTGNVLFIRPARQIFDVVDATNEYTETHTPFADGRPRLSKQERPNGTVGYVERVVRLLIYGQNLSKLSFERKYAGTNVPLVEVVSLDDAQRGAGKLLVAQWPPAGSRSAELKGTSEKVRISYPGIRDQKRLEQIAQGIYEEIGRSEMGGSCETKDLCSFGGDNADPDMLRLRPAAAVEFAVDARSLSSRSPLVALLASHARMGFDELVKEFQTRLGEKGKVGDQNLARVLAATMRGGVVNSLRYFRVATVRFAWDRGSGIRISFDFQNYVVPRHQEQALSASPPMSQKGSTLGGSRAGSPGAGKARSMTVAKIPENKKGKVKGKKPARVFGTENTEFNVSGGGAALQWPTNPVDAINRALRSSAADSQDTLAKMVNRGQILKDGQK